MRRELYIEARNLKKGDFLDHMEILSKRNDKEGYVMLKVQGTTSGLIRTIKYAQTSYHYITRYTK